MDRILLGKNDEGSSGFWVSKPGVNAIAFAGNGYYAGTDPGSDGLRDGKVLPIYGYNENFNFTGDSEYTYSYVSLYPNWRTGTGYDITQTTPNNTLLFVANTSTAGQHRLITSMNNMPNWAYSTAAAGNRYTLAVSPEDRSFTGNDYPIVELRIRKPPKSDGTHWTLSDLPRHTSATAFTLYWRSSNTTIQSQEVPPNNNSDGYPWTARNAIRPNQYWDTIMGTSGEWKTIEYDMEAHQVRVWSDASTTPATYTETNATRVAAQNDWVSNTQIDSFRFDFSIGGTPQHTEPDWEIDYIRAKKRGIPANFGNSLDDNFAFSSDWESTALVHSTGRVTLGNEYAYANGFSKEDGTTHKGSTSGRIDFEPLPYVPVVLFQRYDPTVDQSKVSFPGGDKEFSVAHCDMTSNTQIWNPLTKQYQPSTNNAYGSEYRTFAYVRAGYDHFDLTCRNAIARDGFEHLFNYTPQEPYVEIYKGGNYDPESENPETFVMYPQQMQNVHTGETASETLLAGVGGPGSTYYDEEVASHIDLRQTTASAIDNGLFSQYFQGSAHGVTGFSEDGIDQDNTGDKVVNHPPPTHPITAPKVYLPEDRGSEGITGRVSFDVLADAQYWARVSGWDVSIKYGTSSTLYEYKSDAIFGRPFLESVAGIAEFIQNWGDGGVDGQNFAVGKMKEGTLGVRRGHIITEDNLPSEGFDQSEEGAGGAFKQYSQSLYNGPAEHEWHTGDEFIQRLHGMAKLKFAVYATTQAVIQDFSDVYMAGSIPGGLTGYNATQGNPDFVWTSPAGETKGPLRESSINTSIYQSGGIIGSGGFTASDDRLDWSARDNMDGKLGYFSRFIGTDQGNCLPTFDWANKMGDWNVPQFNNFYQYDGSNISSYKSFKDAIGTSWTANNTKFLDDSMWLGYANNRHEYKGDIWHPQAPTKTYDELSGAFGYGGTIAHQGDWHDFAGTYRELEDGRVDEGTVHPNIDGHLVPTQNRLGVEKTEAAAPPGDYYSPSPKRKSDYRSHPGHGYTGIHVISRYDANTGHSLSDAAGAFSVDIHFRNRYMYRPFNGTHPFSKYTRNHFDATNKANRNTEYEETLAADYQPELGASGPGTHVTYGRLHDYGRTGAYTYSDPTPFATDLTFWLYAEGGVFGYADTERSTSRAQNIPSRINPTRHGQHAIAPPSIFWPDNSTDRLNNFSNPWIEQYDPNETGGRFTGEVHTLSTLGIRSQMRQDLDGDIHVLDKNDLYTPAFMPDVSRGDGGKNLDGGEKNYKKLGGRGSEVNKGYGLEVGSLGSWTEPQTGYYGHKDSFVVSRWYTYPGATFAYDISNFSGPAHYDAWYKNDNTDEVQDYKRRDYPQLYEGGWGNYGYFPTQEQLDAGKGATRLFPASKILPDDAELAFDSIIRKAAGSVHGYGSGSPEWDLEITDVQITEKDDWGLGYSPISGPSTIFKKRAFLRTSGAYRSAFATALDFTDTPTTPSKEITTTHYDHWGTNISLDNDIAADGDGTEDSFPIYLYFTPNHLHPTKQISKTFGIPNDIAGDYYVASTVHNERGANPQVDPNASDHLDPFHKEMGGLGNNRYGVDVFASKWHTKNYNPGFTASDVTETQTRLDHFRKGVGYYHPIFNPNAKSVELNHTTYPDYKLNEYLARNGIDVNRLAPGDPIPIKADPYFAGMAFEGTNVITGAFQAHRFEFKIKKTKSHINHFRQSYEYNLPGRAGHRADTLRPIGYGLISNAEGFDYNHSPPPMAHAYFDARQLGGGNPHWRSVGIKAFEDTDNPMYYNPAFYTGTYYEENQKYIQSYGYDDGSLVDIQHPGFSNTYFANKGWGLHTSECSYDNQFILDPTQFYKEYSGSIRQGSELGGVEGTSIATNLQDGFYAQSHRNQRNYLGVSISRHGRDVMTNGIIGAVEVANTYFADYKATYWDSTAGELRYWITETTTPPEPPIDNNYYNLLRPLRYRPAKSQGASPETQMYGAYLGAPWNRHADYAKAWAGYGSSYVSTGNHWEDDVLPGMCKADNALTNWGTVDLSKFDHNHIGYRWHTDAWHTNDNSGLADSIVWAPSKTKTKWSDATSSLNKGQGVDPNITGKNRITQNQKGGTYDGFKLHERPEFQPVTGDGRYFGGVGGVDNWGGTSYNTWGPSMSVTPTVWELKWTNIQHPLGVAPSASKDSNTFYGSTSIENQTSYIGGAPNHRELLNDYATDYDWDVSDVAANTWSATPPSYDWAIGGHQIQSNYWDRTLKVQDLENHVNNGIDGTWHANTTYHFQYMYDESKINPPEYVYWVLRIPASMDSHNGESLI